MTPGTRRLPFALALFVLLLVSGPTTLLAHAELATADPGDTGILSQPPTEVVLTFTEPLDPARSSIKVVGASGTVVAEGSTVDTSNPKTMRLAVPVLTVGKYTVRWTSSSALDGDLDHGTTTFMIIVPETPTCTDECNGHGSAFPSSASPATVGPSVTASAPPTTPTTSTTDAVLPIVVALVVLGGLGLWLVRGRSRVRR